MEDSDKNTLRAGSQLSLWDVHAPVRVSMTNDNEKSSISNTAEADWRPAEGLWRNADLIQGQKKMNELDFGLAIQFFEKAQKGPLADPQEIEQMIRMCREWKDLELPKPAMLPLCVAWLNSYRTYPFPAHMQSFKRALLRGFASGIPSVCDGANGHIEEVFDELLVNQDYLFADEFIGGLMPEASQSKYRLLYLMAQAKYLAGRDRHIADEYYCMAMIHDPDTGMIERIVPHELQVLIPEHGMAIAAVIYTVRHLLPVYRLGGHIPEHGEGHRQAIEAYALLYEIEQTRHKKSMHDLKLLGMQMRERFPEVFTAYQKMVSANKVLELRAFHGGPFLTID